jgi:hypothetical protein
MRLRRQSKLSSLAISALLGFAGVAQQEPVLGELPGLPTIAPNRITTGFCQPPSFAQGEGILVPTGLYAPSQNLDQSWGVVAADFDEDGLDDLAVAGFQGNQPGVSVLLASASGQFSSPSFYSLAGDAPMRLRAGDLNEDGHVDLLVAGVVVSTLLGSGTGSFQPGPAGPVGVFPWDFSLADLTGDGLLDLLYEEQLITPGLKFLPGNGDGSFGASMTIFSGYVTAHTPADIDGDGDLDAAYQVLVPPTDTRIEIAINNGSGGFGGPRPAFVYPRIQIMRAAHFNQDTSVDLLVGHLSNINATVLFGDGTGFFDTSLDLVIGGNNKYDAAVSDFNGDGKRDFAMIFGEGARVYRGNGMGGFDSGTALYAGTLAYTLSAGDHTGDGLPDLIIGDRRSSDAFFFRNQTAGGLRVPPGHNLDRLTAGIATGDFTQDGHADIVGLHYALTGSKLTVLSGDGNGAFGAPIEHTPVYSSNSVGFVLRTGDFNEDGLLDVIANDRQAAGGGVLQIFLGTGPGTFTNAFADTGVLFVERGLAVDDFNGDDHEDLAVPGFFSGSYGVIVLSGNGQGGFGSPLNVTTGGYPIDLTTGDLNEDGRRDIVAADGLGNVILLLGSSTGAFLTPRVFALSAGALSVSVADFNQDGNEDVVAGLIDKSVAILLGTGTGLFGLLAVVPLEGFWGHELQSLAAEDLNADGNMDVAVGAIDDTVLWVLPGRGDGTFGEVSKFYPGGHVTDLAVADFDEDGRPDVATSSARSGLPGLGGTWVLLNTTMPQPPPSVSAISPMSGSALGGTSVTITGAGFRPGATVLIGGVAASSVIVANATTITAITGPHAVGSTGVTVDLGDCGSATLSDAFFFDFADVPPAHPFYGFVLRLWRNGVTSGCSPTAFCPDLGVTRAQMAVFLLRSKFGPTYTPPPATGTVFADVGALDFAAAYIEQMAALGISAGCAGGNYCPNLTVSRDQMSVFLLIAFEGAGYQPPPATGMFLDVPPGNIFARWIEELARRGITAGCGGGNFCPSLAVSRSQMAVFLSVTFNLP